MGRKLRGDIDWSEKEIKINGICFVTNRSVKQFWKSLCSKAKKELLSWESRNLTAYGKIGVINTCIFPIFYYAAKVCS